MSQNRIALVAFVAGVTTLAVCILPNKTERIVERLAKVPFVNDPEVSVVQNEDMTEKQRQVQTKVTIMAEKKHYLVGEEIYVDHIVENISKVSIEYSKGGDYRAATRHLS